MASTGSHITHRPTRAQNWLPGPASLLQSAELSPETRPPSNGQFDSCCLCQQERRHQVFQLVNTSPGSVGTDIGIWLLDYSKAHPRHFQIYCRCSVSTVQQPLRVDSERERIPSSNEAVLSSDCGPICHACQS